ncbi:ParE family toxin-like protein [Vasconcelosia minhoensis]|uniref:ParE family toxin-like protein n=1 Tax=Vasconcelosia minhoensis TaxID=3366354 RepID=UPI0036F380D6
MKSSTTQNFRKRLSQLPISVREEANKAYALWRNKPYHRSLQFKRVSQRQLIYSVRISLNYRALGLLEENHIYWFWIGTHSEYDELLKRL